jgi:hypothetical protein
LKDKDRLIKMLGVAYFLRPFEDSKSFCLKQDQSSKKQKLKDKDRLIKMLGVAYFFRPFEDSKSFCLKQDHSATTYLCSISKGCQGTLCMG